MPYLFDETTPLNRRRIQSEKNGRLCEDYTKKSRYNFVIYANQTTTMLSQQKKRGIGTLNIVLFYINIYK